MAVQLTDVHGVRREKAELAARESRVHRIAWPAALIVLGSFLAALAMLRVGYEPLAWLATFFAGFGVLTLIFAFQSLRPSNWTMRAMADGMYIKLDASPAGTHAQSGETVIFVPYTDVAEIYPIHQRRVFVFTHDRRQHTHYYYIGIRLRIPLNNQDFAAIQSVSNTRDDKVDDVDDDASVAIPQPEEIRMLWRAPGSRVLPGIKRTIEILSEHVAIGELREETDPYANRTRHAALEARLDELCQQGKRRQAVQVARARFGMSLAEAIVYVDERCQSAE